MERVFSAKPGRKSGGGSKDAPVCELCGRPVRITSADYEREEVLCASCATEAGTPDFEEYELSAR